MFDFGSASGRMASRCHLMVLAGMAALASMVQAEEGSRHRALVGRIIVENY